MPTTKDPRDSIHGEEEVEPRFGPKSGDVPEADPSKTIFDNPTVLNHDPSDKALAKYDSDKSASPSALKNAESLGGVGSRGGLGPGESSMADQLGKGFTGGAAAAASGSPAIRFMAFLARNKRTAIGGSLGGGIFAGLLLLFMTAQGPLELVHLGEVLEKTLQSQQDASSSRFNKLFRNGVYRFSKNGEFGETRVGRYGSRRVNAVVDELKSQGVEFKGRTALGRFKTIEIDPTNPDSPFAGMSDEEIRTSLNLPEDPSIFYRDGGKVVVEADPATVKGLQMQRVLSKTIFKALGKGNIETAMDLRYFRDFFGIPRLFHPIQRKASAKLEDLLKKVGDSKGSVQAEEERAQPRESALKAKFGAARSSLQDKLNGKEDILSGALVTTAVMCLIRSAADDVVAVNQGIVTAAQIEAVDKEAVSSQVKTGQDITLTQAGAVKNSFKDKNGDTIWQAKSLDAIAHNGKGTGKDIPAGYAQAFSPSTTAQNIKDAVSLKISTPAGTIDAGGVACSTPGLIVQAVANLALLIATPLTDGASLAAYTAEQGAKAGAWAGAAYFIQKVFVKLLASDAIVPAVARGPLGGNILAYGARSAANLAARASGGIELAGSFATVVDKDVEQRDQAQFQSKSLFARMFDVNDYRSLSSRIIDNANADPAQEVSYLASSLANFGGLVSGLFSSLIPHASAAVPYYKWPFPRYGIPKSIMNDPALEDPYDNADKTAKILDADQKGDKHYINKALDCFGDQITKQDGLWSVIPGKSDSNPNSEQYTDAHCNDISDYKWRRVILFVFDERLVDAVDCYEGDNDACTRQGIDTGDSGSSSGTSGSTTGGAVSGSLQDLAQQVLDNNHIDKSGRYVMEDLQHTANGQPAYGSVKLDIGILQFLLDAASQGDITVTSITGDGSGHSAGSNHYTGHAVDLGCTGLGNNPPKLIQIASNYHGKNNGERCDRPNPYGYPPHDHFDFFN